MTVTDSKHKPHLGNGTLGQPDKLTSQPDQVAIFEVVHKLLKR